MMKKPGQQTSQSSTASLQPAASKKTILKPSTSNQEESKTNNKPITKVTIGTKVTSKVAKEEVKSKVIPLNKAISKINQKESIDTTSTMSQQSVMKSEASQIKKVPKAAPDTIEEDIRLFKNLRSKLLQWYYSNLKLDHSFSQQQSQAKEEIFDRFMQYYTLKQENFELQRLIQNHQSVSIIDSSLNSQYNLLSELTQLWPLFKMNMDYLGQRLEKSLNNLALGNDVIIEDSDLMIEQMNEINNQIIKSNEILQSIEPFNKEIGGKLDQLTHIINVECEQLMQLQKLAQEKREEVLRQNADKVVEIVSERDFKMQQSALSNTFL